MCIRDRNSAFYFIATCQVSDTEVSKQKLQNFDTQKAVNGADAGRIRWRRIVDVNETIEIRLLVSRDSEKILS